MKKQLLALTAAALAAFGGQAQCVNSIPFMEDFTETPTCWNNAAALGGPWVFSGNMDYDMSSTTDHTFGALNNDYAWIDFSSTDDSVVLESPILEVGSAANVALSFWSKSYYSTGITPFNFLYVEAFDGSTWNQVSVHQGDTGPNWVENILDLTSHIFSNAGVNSVQIRFRAESGGASDDYKNDLAIDDVKIYDPLNYCVDFPVALTVTDITPSEITLNWAMYSGAAGNNFVLEYGPTGFTPGTFPNVINTANNSQVVSGLTTGNSYDFYVYHICASGDTSFFEGPTTETPICLPVTNLDVVSITTSDVDLTWTSGANEFIVEYGISGFTPGTGASATITSATTQNISGLTSNNFYDAYIRVICGPGDTSTYVGPVVFNTYGLGAYMEWDNSCSPLGFVDISQTGTNLNLGYGDETDVVSPFDIVFQNTQATDITVGINGGIRIGASGSNIPGYYYYNSAGNGFAYIWGDYLDEETGDVFMEVVGTAPNRTLILHWHEICNSYGTATSPTANFQIQIFEATQEIYYVYDDVVFGGSNSGDDYGKNADIGISGPNQDYSISTNSDTYLKENSCVRFYYSDCPKVNNLQVLTYNHDEIGLAWAPGLANESNWTIEWGPAGFTPGSGLGTMTTTVNTVTITGLDDLTDYDIYVYADCVPASSISSDGVMSTTQTAPACANPFGISPTGAPDSLYLNWSWQPNVAGALPADFNVTYVPTGQNVYGSLATEVNVGSADFYDSIFDPNLIASGIYDVYVQTVCSNGDTSLYTGPINFLAFLDNDSSCYAQELEVNDTPYILYNTGAQNDPGIQAIQPPADGFNSTQGWYQSSINRSTWYTFVAPASGDLIISGTDVNYYSKMAVYETSNCGDYSQYSLIGANDNGVLYGSTSAAEWVVCGLTPGQSYYLLHSAQNISTSAGTYSIRLTEIELNAGSSSGIVNACIGDTVNLFDGIAGYEVENGSWNDLAHTSQLISDSSFATTVLATQTYNFEYRVQLGCAFDSVIAQVEIFPLSSAGQSGSINVCINEPINLTDGLSGNADLGGVWYDPMDNVVTTSFPMSGTVPGQFNYDYIAGNGVCPDDTALVVVIIDASCDWLGLDEEKIEGISVFPNPTTDILNIQSTGNHDALKAQVVDMNGRVVASSIETLTAGGIITLPVNQLEAGVYILKLYNNTVENSFRIVIK